MKKTEKESLRKVIRSLHQAGKSQREIARSLDIHRDTVKNCFRNRPRRLYLHLSPGSGVPPNSTYSGSGSRS